MTRYDAIGRDYAAYRVPDPRLTIPLHAALGDARTVVNVGAGAGAYEPTDRHVVAVEPSATMIQQRPAGAAQVVQASAEALPFRDGAFDAAMAVLTLHHWGDVARGLREMRRVARRVVLLTWDPAHPGFWLTRDYVPALLALDQALFPPLEAIARELGTVSASPLPIPRDCTDGFLGAYWARPEAYLDPGVRGAISSFHRIADVAPSLQLLAEDLHSGQWTQRYGALTTRDTLDVGYRLIVSSERTVT